MAKGRRATSMLIDQAFEDDIRELKDMTGHDQTRLVHDAVRLYALLGRRARRGDSIFIGNDASSAAIVAMPAIAPDKAAS